MFAEDAEANVVASTGCCPLQGWQAPVGWSARLSKPMRKAIGIIPFQVHEEEHEQHDPDGRPRDK